MRGNARPARLLFLFLFLFLFLSFLRVVVDGATTALPYTGGPQYYTILNGTHYLDFVVVG
jgi:hypothetical protein